MKRTAFAVVFVATGLWTLPALPPAQAMDADVRYKLTQSRYALLAQLKEIQRNYDDASRQIDDLRKKQSLLDSYRRETDAAIREVDRAIAQSGY